MLLKNVKKPVFFILLIPVILGSLFLYLKSEPQSESEIKGDKVFQQHQYLTNEDKVELRRIRNDHNKDIDKASGDTNKIKSINENYKKQESEFFSQLYTKNQNRFLVYAQKIESFQKENSSIWKDNEFIENYFLFQTHVENNRFDEAEQILLILEKKMGVVVH